MRNLHLESKGVKMSRSNGSLLGCLPLIAGLLVLGAFGFCGNNCQDAVLDSVSEISKAVKGTR